MARGTKVLLLVALCALAAASLGEAQTQAPFSCSTEGKTCRALIDYQSPNQTTLATIQSLFNVSHLLDLLGANNLSPTTMSNHTVQKGQILKIAFPCKCSNGSGASDRIPEYVIKKDDTLSHIAQEIFSGLVTWQKIQEVNRIADVTLIQPGQKVQIPLPCSCDQVNSMDVVHYGYFVQSGNTVQQIAQRFGTTQETLLNLNNMTDPKTLQAAQILDVPLKACSSSTVKSDSPDYPLLVANGTVTYTANGCVKCSCDSASNAILQCEPSQAEPYDWSTCPSMKCGSFTIGNITNITSSCNRTICAYAGFSSQTISATLAPQSTCPAPAPAPAGSAASRMSHQGWVWSHLLIAIHLILFSLHFL